MEYDPFGRNVDIYRDDIERENPLVKLSDEEMDYFESEILPNLDKRPDEKRG